MIPVADLIGTHDIVWITLDSLRYDVAQEAWAAGRTPHLARFLPTTGWEERHSPASFTYPAHLAFLGGFLPAPPGQDRPARMFAGSFDHSIGARPGTLVFDEADVPAALRARGYHTVCLGGVGFFSRRGALGSVIPDLFDESHWSPATGPRNKDSAKAQADVAVRVLAEQPDDRRLFLLLNIAATHTPTHYHLPGARRDSPESQAAALAYADEHLGRVIDALRRPTVLIVCSDHGDCFGEDGWWGHGIAHPLVWTVPYAEVVLT
ncbi:STM4013/SEN3800 family hydrolase [Ammonicoccus fulvus]|uniref:STM4013/SEN3800 family hydrolase n=1 Tax=Ammonicoccus fulvus TaxID=3138240 RepID=A0ABZ3FSE5_9ACTN